jgi:hypothetical protein
MYVSYDAPVDLRKRYIGKDKSQTTAYIKRPHFNLMV